MLVKELRQGLRARGFVGALVGFQVIMVIAFFFAVAQPGREAINAANGTFWTITGAMLLVVMPLRALAGLGAEIEGRTVDLLVLTRLTAWRIVLGKWVSLVVQSALLASALLPYGVVRYYLGPVDLATDLGIVALMLAGSALLTAVALWASGWSRGVRVLVGLGLLLAVFVVPNVSRAVYYSGYRPGYSPYGARAPVSLLNILFNPNWSPTWWFIFGVALFVGVLLGLFALVQAARRLAPSAENHALATRALALLTLLPAPVLAVTLGEGAALSYLWLAALAVLAVCGMEVAQVAVALGVHARPWWRRGSWHTLVGRFALPGWPSAALFCAVALVCLFATVVLCDAVVAGGLPFDLRFGAWWLAQGWVALVAPVLLLSFWRRHARMAIPAYWITQGLLGIVSLISLANTPGGGWGPGTKPYVIVLDAVSQIVPVSAFWLGWRWVPANANFITLAVSPVVMLGQAAVLLATVWLYRRRSRDYWAEVWARQARPAEDGVENAPDSPPALP
jgi:ABC-type transport system involved in multi-copper enzyme maturation permease subunit